MKVSVVEELKNKCKRYTLFLNQHLNTKRTFYREKCCYGFFLKNWFLFKKKASALRKPLLYF